MKNLFEHFDDAQTLVNQIADYDFTGMASIISMMIDTCAAKYDVNAHDVADMICGAVHEVNNDLGPYRLF